jgi:predicted O-methyltransferase YrrM
MLINQRKNIIKNLSQHLLQKKKQAIAKHKYKYSFLSENMKQEIQEIINNAKKIISNDLLPIIKSVNESLEGNIFMFHHTTEYTNEFFDKQVNFILAAKRENINSILEIGFNAGFSTLLMLLTNKTIKITCVDICQHSYTKLCFLKLKEIFGDRLELLPGSSVGVVPTLEGNIYDLIHIDGCHLVDIAELDIINSLKLCKTGTLLIMDDTQDTELYNLWYKYVIKHNLQDIVTGNFVDTKYHNIKMYP